MRRALLPLLLLWSAAVNPALAEPVFRTHEDFSRWFTYYYVNPEPNRLPDAIQYMSKLRMLDNKSHVQKMAGFLSGIFLNNPDKVASWVEQLSSLREQHVGVVILGLWYAAT